MEKFCPNISRIVLVGSKTIKGIKSVDTSKLSLLDLAPSGNPDRLLMFTESSIKKLGEFLT